MSKLTPTPIPVSSFPLLLEITDVKNLLVDRKWLPTNHTLTAKERGWQGGDVEADKHSTQNRQRWALDTQQTYLPWPATTQIN
jgi:hypothetical protein